MPADYLSRVVEEARYVIEAYLELRKGSLTPIAARGLEESIAVHVRNLARFFKLVRVRGRRRDELTYLPYLERGKARPFREEASRCRGLDNLQELVRWVNKNLTHLTNAEYLKMPNLDEPIRAICCVLSIFSRYLGKGVDGRVIGELNNVVEACIGLVNDHLTS